jgi:hypothetical protein
MKKQVKYILTAMVFFCYFNISAQETRNVIWVHGFDGNVDSWKHYEQVFSAERRISSLRRGYDTKNGIENCANKVIEKVDEVLQGNAQNPRNIAIAHSMGGLTVRDVDRITGSNKRFGGIITVTAPHYGAPIANSIADGSVERAVDYGYNQMAQGPINQLYNIPWIIEGNYTSSTLYNLMKSCYILEELYHSPESRSDLQSGSAKVNQINAFNTTIPIICMWAWESTPVNWRFFSSNAEEGNDENLFNTIQTIRNAYKLNFEFNRNLAISNWWNPGVRDYYKWRAAEWKKGLDWIDNSESMWSALIKTSRIEPYTYTYCEYTCIGTIPEVKIIEPIEEPCNYQWVCRTVTQYVSVNYPSDGFIPVYSQKLQGLPSGNYYELKNANHIEVRNMKNCPTDWTRVKFNEIFNRDDYFGTSLK